MKRQDLGLLSENYTHFKNLSSEQFQIISDFVINKIQPPVEFREDTKTSIKYLDKFEIDIPEWYLKCQGHKLESLLKQAFKSLGKFNKETELKKEIVYKVIDDLPELISSDF